MGSFTETFCVLQLKVSQTPIQWWYLEKMLEVLGEWPGNALEKKYMVTVTLLLSSQGSFVVSARTALLSARYVTNKQPTDGWDHFTRLRTASSVLFTGPRIIVSYILYNFIESCDGEWRYYTIDSEVCGLANAKCSQRVFGNHNLSITLKNVSKIFLLRILWSAKLLPSNGSKHSALPFRIIATCVAWEQFCCSFRM